MAESARKDTRPNEKKSAIEGKRLNAFAIDPSDLTIIGLDTDDGADHPLYDERIKLDVPSTLVANIRVYGVIEPVIVRKNGDTVEVVDGRQRVRAARLANEENTAAGLEPIAVPVMIKRGTDETMAGVMISTNEQRQEDQLATKLKKLERYLALGRTVEDAAVAFGVSVATVNNWLTLLEAGPAVKKAFTAGQLSASAAVKLAKLSREDQAEAVAAATADGKATTAKAGRVVKAKKEGTAAKPDIVPPSKKIIKKVSAIDLLTGAHAIGRCEEQQAGFALALAWVLGKISTNDIDGLAELLESETTTTGEAETHDVESEAIEKPTWAESFSEPASNYEQQPVHAPGE